jgi:hypothetical protein
MAKSRSKSEAQSNLNQKVDPDFHRAVKVIAARHRKTIRKVIEEAFRCWVQTYGDREDKLLLPP